MLKLILFDIDGTLLSAGGAAARAFRRGLLEVFGTAGPIDGHSFGGKTDPQIAHELLGAAGLSGEAIAAGLPDLWDVYLDHLPGELARVQVRVLPGIPELLQRLERHGDRAVLGLLTGNIEMGARMKLDASGLGFDRFVVGAFGSDHADRPELPAVAVARAEQRFGHRFVGEEIVIIGDTPHDISCGERLGVRTVAVATGSYTTDQLLACEPDFVLPDLGDHDAVWDAVFSG